ncbi:amidohydrolase family protein [Sorangium sp. So ce260]|uniref:amidohydrolase family protein n=1 Tax=Sorangium sp. So ce260 TaxID=3133291 RepID=UPI003F607FEC
MHTYRVIDGDGHCVERDAELAEHAEYLGKPLRGASGIGAMPLFPSLDGWFRVASDKLSAGDAESWGRFLDKTRIEATVLHPTSGLAFGLVQDPDWSASLARAYNDWLFHRYLKVDRRFHGLALLPLHRPQLGAVELRRAVTELGMKGAVLPTSTVLNRGYGDPHFYPIYEEAQRLGCVLTLHGAPSKGMGFDFFDTFIKVHTLEHPIAMMIQFTSMMFDGVFERFPDVRFAFFEAGIGWVPYMMDRMDEEYERRGKRWAPLLKKAPSEYVRSGNLYFSAEVEEKMLPYAASVVGEDVIMFASDFPHERDHEEFLGDIGVLVERGDVSDQLKRKVLFDNANRCYKLGLD